MSKSGGVDELEALSNTDLRARCIEYGLPNVPITDTSRKLLIRRLRAAIDGGDAKPTPSKANKSRRETINVVTKVIEPEVEASPKKGRTVNSRRTIASAAAELVTVEKPPTVELTVTSSSIPQRRRSGRMTPNPPQPEPIISTTVKRKATIIDEESDEDETDDVQIIENNRPQMTRASRSPSLAKSKTVTTSYQHFQEKQSIPEEPVYMSRETIIPVRIESSYQSPASKPSIITTTYERREASPYLPRQAVQLSRPSLTASGNNAGYTTQHASTSSTTRRYTTSGYKPPTTGYSSPSNLGYRTQVNEYLHNAENSDENAEEDEEDDEESNLDAPYLSDFARRLSRLKAEPLMEIPGSLKKESSQLRESQQRYYTTSIGGRRGISKRDSLGDSFRQFWVAIDRKYGLRKYLAVVAIILVALFVYIFFFQQN